MTELSFDGELMTQIFPAQALTKAHANTFFIARHGALSPLVFSLGDVNVMYLTQPGNAGQKAPIDLNVAFGLATDSQVSALAVTQDGTGTEDTIYIAFSVAPGGGSDQPSTLYVVQPKPSVAWAEVTAQSNLSSWLLSGTLSPSNMGITQLHLGTNDDVLSQNKLAASSSYPLLVAAYVDLGSGNHDVTHIEVDLGKNQWTCATDLSLPVNATAVQDMCCGSLPNSSRGLYILSEVDGNPQMDFVGLENPTDGHAFNASIQVPADASCIKQMINQDGYTDLAVGGSGLFHLVAKDVTQAIFSTPTPKLVTNQGNFASIQQLHIAQSQSAVSVWVEGSDQTIAYLKMTQDAAITTPPIPLLSHQEGGGRFAALLHADSSSQKLFVFGDDGNFKAIFQNGDTGLWQIDDVLIPSSDRNVSATSYTTHIHLADKQSGIPLRSTQQVLLCTPSLVDLTVNGQSFSIGPDGVAVTPDGLGNITVIQRVNDATGTTLTFKDVNGGQVLGQNQVVDPTRNVQNNLAKITSGTDLSTYTLPSGKKLLNGTGRPDQVSQASGVISQIHGHMSKLPSDGATVAYQTYADGSFGEWLWDAWHWVTHEADKALDWAVSEVGEVLKVILTLGDEVFTFVATCISHCLQAIGTILEKIGAEIERIIEFLGYLFEWDDILDMHTILVNIVNTSLDQASSAVESAKPEVDGWFAQIQNKIQSLEDVPDDVRNQKGSLENTYQTTNKGPDSNPSAVHPGANWSQYQVQHGGVKQSLDNVSQDHAQSSDPLVMLWDDIFNSTLEGAEDALHTLLQSFLKIFNPSSQFTIGEILETTFLKVASDMVDVIQKVVDTIMSSVGDIIGYIKTILNKEINIPLLTSLYDKIAHTKAPFTLLRAICLIVAIPCTIMLKTIAGMAPSHLPVLAFQGEASGLTTALDFIGPFVSVIVHFISMEAAPISWEKARLASFNDPVPLVSSIFGLAGDIISLATSRPSHSPDPFLGNINWGLGALGAITRIKCRPQTRAMVMALTAVVQAGCEFGIAVEDWAQPDTAYDKALVGVTLVEAVAATIAKLAARECCFSANPDTIEGAVGAAMFKWLVETVKMLCVVGDRVNSLKLGDSGSQLQNIYIVDLIGYNM